MVVRDDGTKWACQSCLKGHRVSGCNHTDRELKLVPKKGRPVTQCQHCRQERKKRSAHVKCDCAESDKPHHSKEKCIHLREAEERAKASGFHDDGGHHEQDPSHLAAVAEEQGCCCHHGGKCTCAFLKNDDEFDGKPSHGKPAVSKPRLECTKSEGMITVFANGHHKPVHRNHAAHESGMPYKIPMPRSKTDHDISLAARRSVDSLGLDASAWRSEEASMLQVNTQAFQLPPELSKSEQTSPRMLAHLLSNSQGLTSDQFNLIDFSDLDQVTTNDSMQSGASRQSALTPMEPMSGISAETFDAWPTYSSTESAAMPNNNPFGVWPTNTDVTGLAQPALTAASSNTQSEVDEVPMMDDVYGPGMPSIEESVPNYDIEATFVAAAAAAAAAASPQSNRRSLPPNFFGNNDITIPSLSDDWQDQSASLESGFDSKAKSTENLQTFALNDPWQLPGFPPSTDLPRRPAPGTQRPAAQSVGSTSAPNGDIMKQLFPDMDLGNNDTQLAEELSVDTKLRGVVNTSRSSIPISYNATMDNLDSNSGDFTAQSWADGSMSVPNDTFASDFEFNQDYPSPGFIVSDWTQ